jgi:hypothetical protein
MDETCDRIARAMGCEPDSGDDLVEAVRLLVPERDAERAHWCPAPEGDPCECGFGSALAEVAP